MRNIYRPIIPIQLRVKERITTPIDALIDSGSDRNLFPAAYGVFIGIDLRKGITNQVRGIGDFKLKTYTHKLELILADFEKYHFTTEIDFSYEQKIPILGRNGFFNLFQAIKFKEKEKLIELTL